MGGDLFKGLEGIVVEADELRAGVGVDGQTVDAGGLGRSVSFGGKVVRGDIKVNIYC
jgi:hypothetical protein